MKLIAARPRLKFSELFADVMSRTEVVVTFLAMLELIRLKQIICVQPETFGEIEISLKPAPAAPAPPAAILEPTPGAEPWSVAQPDTLTA